MTPRDLKIRLVSEGKTLRWFHDHYIKNQTGLTYSGFMSQLNGYTKLSETVVKEIQKYLNDLQ
jgi:hypothetical protein